MQVKYMVESGDGVSEAKEWKGRKVQITVLGADQKPIKKATKKAMDAFIARHKGKRMLGIPSPAREVPTKGKEVVKNERK